MTEVGLLTVDGHTARRLAGEDLRVYLDGVDVTGRCVKAHDVEGWVMLYCHDPVSHSPGADAGKSHLGPRGRGVCSHLVRGAVEIRT